MQTILDQPTTAHRNPVTFTNTKAAPAWQPPVANLSTKPRPVAAHVTTEEHAADPAATHNLLQALLNSRLFQEYQRAFNDATGLPLALRPVETWSLPLHGKRNEGSWCALMATKSKNCAACLQMQEQLALGATTEACTMTCSAGLSETMVPVRLGEKLVGYLQTGQVFHKTPTETQFERTCKGMRERGVEMDREEMRKAYFSTQTMAAKQHESAVKLLGIFARHLSMLSNQIFVRQENSEPPMITRAKKFIEDHQTEDISLTDVAKAVNASSFYFCKMFRKATGVNYTDYLARVRIERAKNLLLNPNLRISEIAYEVGFQSLTHFNRVFKRILGQSPTDYRVSLEGN